MPSPPMMIIMNHSKKDGFSHQVHPHPEPTSARLPPMFSSVISQAPPIVSTTHPAISNPSNSHPPVMSSLETRRVVGQCTSTTATTSHISLTPNIRWSASRPPVISTATSETSSRDSPTHSTHSSPSHPPDESVDLSMRRTSSPLSMPGSMHCLRPPGAPLYQSSSQPSVHWPRSPSTDESFSSRHKMPTGTCKKLCTKSNFFKFWNRQQSASEGNLASPEICARSMSPEEKTSRHQSQCILSKLLRSNTTRSNEVLADRKSTEPSDTSSGAESANGVSGRARSPQSLSTIRSSRLSSGSSPMSVLCTLEQSRLRHDDHQSDGVFPFNLNRLIEKNIRLFYHKDEKDELKNSTEQAESASKQFDPSPTMNTKHPIASPPRLHNGNRPQCSFLSMIDQIVSSVFSSSSLSPEPGEKEQVTRSESPPQDSISRLDSKCGKKFLAKLNISPNTYRRIIDFEFNQGPILTKFGFKPSGCYKVTELNELEKARIEELERVLYPLQYCLSAMSRKQAIIKRYIHKCFFDDTANVSFDYQQKTMLRTAESSINLLISLTKQLDSFSQLTPGDQMSLLRGSVMQMMVIRNLLMTSRKPYPGCTKRMVDGDSKDPCGEGGHGGAMCGKIDSKLFLKRRPSDSSVTSCSEPLLSTLAPNLTEGELESIEQQFAPNEKDQRTDESAVQYGQRFRFHYWKLAQSFDQNWQDDKYIFYLVFAILLFRPYRTSMDETDKVRNEYFTYLYLLKRYMEHKFRSYCQARSHFVRIFDRLEELEDMNEHVIQKLLDFNLSYAQNLLENLCIC